MKRLRVRLRWAAAIMLWVSLIPLGRSLTAQTLETQAGFGVTMNPSLTSISCEFSNLKPVYRGTCFLDDSGKSVYWIVRRWEDGQPVGPAFTGYPSVLSKQTEYIRWTFANLSMTLEPRRDWMEPDGQIRLEMGKDPSHGWDGDLFELPMVVNEIGAIDGNTVRIPHYMSGRQILLLWRDFQDDCRAVPGGSGFKACGKSLREYPYEGLPIEHFPEPSVALKVRADQLKDAYWHSVLFGKELKRCGVSGWNQVSPETLAYPGLTDDWAEAQKKVLRAIKDAKGFRDAYRAAGASR